MQEVKAMPIKQGSYFLLFLEVGGHFVPIYTHTYENKDVLLICF